MNNRNGQIALWVIAVCAMIFLIKNIFLPENRFQITPWAGNVLGPPERIVARIDTKTGEIKAFVYDPRDQKFKTVNDFIDEK